MRRFSEKVVVVTGGASGLGKASAIRFSQEGARVVIGDVDASEGKQIAEQVNGLFIKTDVSDPAAVMQLVDTATQQYGRLDVMFNNAGIRGPAGPLTELRLEDYQVGPE